MNIYSKTVIAIANIKESALFFDHIIPVNLGIELIKDSKDGEIPKTIPPEFREQLFPPNLFENRHFGEQLAALNVASLNLNFKLMINKFCLPPKIGGVTDEEYARDV